ncbi:MAG TPA: DUF11 domain-containing protein [Enteractinococcus sp.]
MTNTTATAAPGDPFPVEEPAIFISQGSPNTTLYRATLDGTTLEWDFEAEGTATNVEYNGIGWNPRDGYIYGFVIANGKYPRGTIVRVGEGGVVEPVDINAAPTYQAWAGAFHDNGNLYAINSNGTQMTWFDVQDGTSGTVNITGVPADMSIWDFVYSDGYFWSLASGRILRINPENGTATAFQAPFQFTSGSVGAAWRFGNGNLGFGENNGVMHQVAITNPGSAQPIFELISSQSTPSHSRNDGTSVPGLPADLSIEKTGDQTFIAGEEFEYQLTVRNNGQGVSSGWTVTDELPEGVTLVDVQGEAQWDDSVTDQVRINGGRLGIGEERVITLTVTADDINSECITNVASILGNEADPDSGNNSDSTETCQLTPGLTIEKTSNATADVRVGDTIEYTVRATNNTEANFTAENPAVVFDDLSGLLDDAVFNDDAVASMDGDLGYAEPLLSWSGPLASGETVELTYTVTLQGGGDGEVRNVAWVPNNPEDPTSPVCNPRTDDGTDPDTGEACGLVENLLPRLIIDKSADRTDLPAEGEEVTYTITVTNEGPGDYTSDAPATFSDDLSNVLDDANLVEESLSASTGDLLFNADEETITWNGALEANQTATIQYTMTYTGAGDQQLDNLVCVPGEEIAPGAQACDMVNIPGSGLTQWKTVESSDSPAVAGSVLTYTLYFENTGQAPATVDAIDDLSHVVDDAEVTAEPTADNGLEALRDEEIIAITGTVPVGETLRVTYEVTVLPDGQRGDDVAANFLMHNDPDNPPTAPEDPICEPMFDERADCTATPIGVLSYEKTVESSDDPLVEGSELTYSIIITNSGQTTMDVAREDVLDDVLDDTTLVAGPTSDTDSVTVTDVDDNNRFQIAGDLAAGQTATITYTVEVNSQADRGNNSADNFLVVPGETPPGECESNECTVTPLPFLEVTKDVDPESGSTVVAGQQLTYTLTFNNSGGARSAVDYTDHLVGVLDDAKLITQPTATNNLLTASAVADNQFTVSGSLEAGETETVTYTVEVNDDGEREDNVLGNFLVPTGEEPPAECEDSPCTTNPVPHLESWKTVEADTTPVSAGTVLTYTLHFENIGAAAGTVDKVDDLTHVLDDATLNTDTITAADPLTVSELDDNNQLTITGALEAGATATVTYQVTVNANGERGDDIAANFLLDNTPEGEDPPTPPEDPTCEPTNDERPDCTTTPIGALTYEKSVATTDDPLVEGSELTYAIVISNTGQTTMAVALEDVLDDVLDDTTLVSGPTSDSEAITVSDIDDNNRFEITGELASGETATVTYTVALNAQDDRGNNTADNFVVPTGQEPPTECEDNRCTVTPLPMIEATKDVDPASGTTVVAGEQLTYTLTFTNSGGAAGAVDFTDHLSGVLDDAELVTQPSATEDLLEVSAVVDEQFQVTGILDAGATETVTYTVEVGADGQRGDNVLGNFLVETGEEPPTECDGFNCTTNPVPQLEDWKTVEADNTPVVAGTVLTYTLHFENTGAATGTVDKVDDLTHVLDDAILDIESVTADEPLTVSELDANNQLTITGALGAGETATVTYQVTINADGERGDDIAANFLLDNTPDGEDPPTPPTEAVCQPADSERPDCTATPIGHLLVTKAVNASTDPVEAGTELTYTLTFDNQGQGPVAVDHTDILTDVLDDATISSAPTADDDALEVSEIVEGQFTVTGELAAGQTVVVEYTVTVNDETDRGNDTADNFLVPTGEEPTCEEGSALCTSTPLPNLSVDKSVNPESGSTVVAGDQLTYTLTFTNSGKASAPVNYTDHLTDVLDDAVIIDEPVASTDTLTVSAIESGRFTVNGTLEPDAEATVTYTVEVSDDGERGNNVLGNFLVETGQEPPTECTDGACTTNPVPHIQDWKTVNPASNTPVVSGQELTYTLHFENVGAAAGTVEKVDDLTHVLDDAEVIAEPVASGENWEVNRDGQRIEFSGEVAPGATETIQYTVRVLEADERGDDLLANFLLAPDTETPTEPVCEPTDEDRPDCTINPVGNIVPTKSVDPATGTEVRAGQELTYTLSFENTGTGAADIEYIDHMADVLDDAQLVGDIETDNGASVAGPAENQLLISGSVAPGETATVTYTVVVNDYEDRGNHHLGNFLTLAGQEPPTECTDNNPLCTFNPAPTDPPQAADPADPQPGDPSQPGDDLASTGVAAFWYLIALAVALLGFGALLHRARNRRSEN